MSICGPRPKCVNMAELALPDIKTDEDLLTEHGTIKAFLEKNPKCVLKLPNYNGDCRNIQRLISGYTSIRTQTHAVDLRCGVVGTISNVFSNCLALTRVDMPHITRLKFAAFRGCVNLEEVNMPHITHIWGSVFGGCTKLNTVRMQNLKALTPNAFKNCLAIKNVTCPTTVIELVLGDATGPVTVTESHAAVSDHEVEIKYNNIRMWERREQINVGLKERFHRSGPVDQASVTAFLLAANRAANLTRGLGPAVPSANAASMALLPVEMQNKIIDDTLPKTYLYTPKVPHQM